MWRWTGTLAHLAAVPFPPALGRLKPPPGTPDDGGGGLSDRAFRHDLSPPADAGSASGPAALGGGGGLARAPDPQLADVRPCPGGARPERGTIGDGDAARVAI